MKKSQLKELIKEEIRKVLSETELNNITPNQYKKGDPIMISKDVSNRPLGGYATFWEYTNGRIGYKTAGSKNVTYVDPQYVTPRK